MKKFSAVLSWFANNFPVLTKKQRTCLECSGTIVGRTDKKFCTDGCRIAYNNRRNSEDSHYVRNINNILRKNRRILVALNRDGNNKVHLERMRAVGFDFNYFTSTNTAGDGSQYFYCYEQGYVPLEKDQCMLVVKRDQE